jgi:class 3 adenylate cyclase/putative methionine-R-sulfoxide reductase with GAF domain
MESSSLRKLLNKRKILPLLKDFQEIIPGIQACHVLDITGGCITGFPEKIMNDFSIDIKRFPDAGHLRIDDFSIGSLFFINEEYAGIVVVRFLSKDPPDFLEKMVQYLGTLVTQFLKLGLEKREIVLDALDKYREITLLYTIGEKISSCLDVDQIIYKILEINQQFIKSENSSVMFVNRETGELEIKAAIGWERSNKTQLKIGVGIAGLVAGTGRPEIVNNPGTNQIFTCPEDLIRNLLCVPLKVQDKVLGVINVSNKASGNIFTAADEKLLMTLASQAATAIENANLIRELQNKNQALEAALIKVELLEKAKKHLSKFVPQSVQKLINDNPDHPELDKNKKHVSILFLDIAGYTKISESLDQEQVDYLIEKYFSSFLDDIHQNKGDINETAGDGLMIIFQNSDPSIHAFQAANTALAIRKKTLRINDELQDKYKPVQVNIGINSGMASVGSVKFEGITGTRWTYTASGMVTNLAARITNFATSGSIVVSERSAHFFSDQFELDDLGEKQFKNIKKPIHIFRLLGRKGERHGQKNPHY